MKLSPLEVDRYLYGEVENTFVNIVNGQFPTPREVDRELYIVESKNVLRQNLFPSSLEVDRYLYALHLKNKLSLLVRFPSPLEVDRYLY